jgi:uncharacterized membrane protein
MATVDHLRFALMLFAALGCGIMAGVFFAFSGFVMNALSCLPPTQGIAAMQSINVAVINPLFGLAFFGTAVACVLLTVYSLLMWHKPGALYLLGGSLLYLVGTILVTMLLHVPQNDALADVDPASPDSAGLWYGYVASWTTWNHVRTTAALVATASFTIALCS